MEDVRKVEVLMVFGGWTEVPFHQVVEGDIFRLFESTGERVYDELHNGEFIAQSDAHERDGVWCVISDGEFI